MRVHRLDVIKRLEIAGLETIQNPAPRRYSIGDIKITVNLAGRGEVSLMVLATILVSI